MNTIPYIGATGIWSLMGLLLPLITIGAIALNLTNWKPTANGDVLTKGLTKFALVAVSAAWATIWLVGFNAHSAKVDAATDRTVAQFENAYGVTLDKDIARDIVEDKITDAPFKATAEGQTIYLTANWDDEGLHLNSVGNEVAVLLPNNL